MFVSMACRYLPDAQIFLLSYETALNDDNAFAADNIEAERQSTLKVGQQLLCTPAKAAQQSHTSTKLLAPSCPYVTASQPHCCCMLHWGPFSIASM